MIEWTVEDAYQILCENMDWNKIDAILQEKSHKILNDESKEIPLERCPVTLDFFLNA